MIIASNKNIVSGSDYVDQTIKVWDSNTFKVIANLKEHVGSVLTLSIINTNENIVSGSNYVVDQTIRVWDSKLISTLTGYRVGVYALVILPSNKNIVSRNTSFELLYF